MSTDLLHLLARFLFSCTLNDACHVCAEGLTFTEAGEFARTIQPKAEPKEEAPAEPEAVLTRKPKSKPSSKKSGYAHGLRPAFSCPQNDVPER